MRTLGTLALLLVALGAYAQDGSWIEDGGFEAGDEALWSPATISREITHSGNGALRVDCPPEGRVTARYPEIELNQTEPETILAKMWLRLEATQQIGPVRGGVSFHLQFVDGTTLSWYGPFEIRPQLAGSWIYHEGRIKARAPIAKIRPGAFLQGVEGALYVDEIYLGPATDLPPVERTTAPIAITGKAGRFTHWPRFELTSLQPTAHVFHFVDSDTTNIELEAQVNVLRTAPAWLTSSWGSQYWTLYSPGRRELAEIQTEERLDLSREGPQNLSFPMNAGHHNYADELSPGDWVIITDRFKSFLIYGTDQEVGEPYLDANTGATFTFWDSAELDPLSRALGPSGMIAPFSVADLSAYEFAGSGYWRDGEMIVRPMLIDARGNRIPLHGLSVRVDYDGQVLRARETRTAEGVPTGNYSAEWPDAPVDGVSARVRASVSLATPDGPVRESFDDEITIAGAPAITQPQPLELVSWGSGHYAVANTAADGPASVERLTADAKAAGITRLIVSGRGTDADAYVSAISRAPRPEFDELAAAAEEGRRQGVEIYAGYALGWVQEADIEAHPDWAQRKADGSADTWYCYNNPEVRAFHASLVAEIGSDYDVAGIALDAVRPGGGCHCDLCSRLFEERYGRPLAEADGYDPDWQQFRRDSITEYVRELRAALREADPEKKLAGYVWGRLGADADRAGQDWPRWLNEDLMDWVCVGQYTPSTAMYRAQCHVLKTIADRDLGGDTTRIFPLMGPSYIQGAFPSYAEADAVIDRHLRAAREEGMTGAGYFPTSAIRTHIETSARHARR
jgi:hypothetical protein